MTPRQPITWTWTAPTWDDIKGRLTRLVDSATSLMTDDRRRHQLVSDFRHAAGGLRHDTKASVGRSLGAMPFVRRRRDQARRRMLLVAAIAGAAGAVAALLLDPDRGRSRRAYLRDRLAAAIRRFGRRVARGLRFVGSTTAGVGAALSRRGRREPLDDVSLAHKVETELFRDPSIDKGRMNVNAERGVVYLRGTAETPERISAIEDRTRQIAGVRAVENLLHLPGTPARRASIHGRDEPAGQGIPEPVGADSSR
jgi:hypothetical protein